MNKLKNILEINGDEVIINNKCGLHIHFDSQCLTNNPSRFKNFMKLYAESEELLYKICNDKNDPIRKHAIYKNFKGIHLISSLWRNGIAAPTGKKILKQIEDGTLKVTYNKFGKLKMFTNKYKLDERRYRGLNLTNIGNRKKNTIEFRMANGTLNPETIKQNVFLYASLINTAIHITEKSQQFQEKLETFYRTDVTEEQKVQSFLKLIMKDQNDINIYMERWQSVKNATVFSKTSQKIFPQNRFKREEFKQIAVRTPANRVKSAYSHIKQIIIRTNQKGDFFYDR